MTLKHSRLQYTIDSFPIPLTKASIRSFVWVTIKYSDPFTYGYLFFNF